MFTGIIRGMGKVLKSDGRRMQIALPFGRLQLGESVAIDGVCLTIAERKGNRAVFDVGPATRKATTLHDVRPGDAVNVEPALRYGERVGGHWVLGHVEGVGKVLRITRSGRSWWMDIEIPTTLRRYMMPKGSVTINGISLTIADKTAQGVRIMLIPHTLKETTMGRRRVGDAVNIEADVVAKYALMGKNYVVR